MKKWVVMCVGLAILMATNGAFAGLVTLEAIGDPVEGGSWSQLFRLTASGSALPTFNSMLVEMVSTGDSFDMELSPPKVLSSFSSSFTGIPSVAWSQNSGPTSTSASASGVSLSELFFVVHFGGNTWDGPLDFDLHAYYEAGVVAVWEAHWQPDEDYIGQPGGSIGEWTINVVPLPASILLGVFAVGLAGRKLRTLV